MSSREHRLTPRDRLTHTPRCRSGRDQQLWRTSSMNRKTLVLPACRGLLAPALAACGGAGDGGGDDAIVVGTTDRSPPHQRSRPPSTRRTPMTRRLERLRQTFQTLMAAPRAAVSRSPTPPRSAASPTPATSTTVHAAQGPEVLRRRAADRRRREVLHRAGPRHQDQGRQRPRRPGLQRRRDRDPGRPRASSSTSRSPTPRSRTSSPRPPRPSSAGPLRARTSCATAST